MNLSIQEEDIPIPINRNYVSLTENHNLPLQNPPFTNKKTSLSVKYKECLKNHAASIGGNATDGCGEFISNGEKGTLESLKCSACNCHRNFHRKQIEENQYPPFEHNKESRIFINSTGNSLILANHSLHNQMIIPFSSIQNSECDEIEGRFGPLAVKKRFRTKFSAEQRDKMLCFAEKIGWKLQREEENLVEELCNEIGIRRRVFKVWMHNNKNSLAKRNRNVSGGVN